MVAVQRLFARAGNEALSINPPNSNIDIHLTKHGSDWLWAAFSIFSVLAIIHALRFSFLSSKTQRLKKIFSIAPLFSNAILAYCYFTYASNLGYTSTRVEFHHVRTSEDLNVRQVFYVKYIGWFLSWPFVLFAMEVATHKVDIEDSLNDVIGVISSLVVKVLATEIYVLGLLIGILIPSSYRWGYFTFSLSAQLFAMSLIGVSIIRSIRGTQCNKIATLVIMFEMIVWILYPVCWGVSEGGNKIQPDSEAVFYGILDLITFGVVPTILSWINSSTVDEDFFRKMMHWNLHSHSQNEKVDETPRHSGDTAIPSTNVTNNAHDAENPVVSNSSVNEPIVETA